VQDCDAETVKPNYQPRLEGAQEQDDRTIQRHADKLQSLIAILCNNDPNAAARSIIKVLNADNYHLVKDVFHGEFMTVEKKIVSGIKSFLADHLSLPEGGTRQTALRNAIDAVMLATVWNLESTERMGSDVSRTLDVRRVTVNEYITYASAMKEKGERFKPMQRKMRKDNVQEASYTYIQRWQHNDDNTRIDTNTWKEQKSINPFTNEEQTCSRRVWHQNIETLEVLQTMGQLD
jgi:hypothetical protein